tara:strand:- start:303 stop:1040 length:738 start_codon:yes stop_codon:yes gene_type:complete
MFNNTRDYNEILQFITLFLLIVIGVIVYYMNENTTQIETNISKLDLKCPECPKCPELTDKDGNLCPKCPDCNCPEGNKCPTINCPTTNCPSVDDIISGIFPGRNTGITSSGKFFDIQASENYELMPTYDFYQSTSAFPSDSILTAPDSLIKGNINIPANQINNTYDNNLLISQQDRPIIDSRMSLGFPGERTDSLFGLSTLNKPERLTGEQARERSTANQRPEDTQRRNELNTQSGTITQTPPTG